MEGFATIEMRLNVTQVEEGLLVRMIGKCAGEHNEVALRLGEQKVDRSADRSNAKRKFGNKDVMPKQFFREYIFPCQECIEYFYKLLED